VRWDKIGTGPEDCGMCSSQQANKQSGPREPIGKHIPAATNTHATIEEPFYKQRIGKHTTRDVVENRVFCSVLANLF
jgi:hypothetical protein